MRVACGAEHGSARRRRRARAWAVLVGLAACSPPAPDPLLVTATLAEERKGPPLVARAPDGTAAGDDIRPAIVSTRPKWLQAVGPAEAVDGRLRRAFRIGPWASGKRLLVLRRVRPAGEKVARKLPPLIGEAQGSELIVDFGVGPDPDPDATDVRAAVQIVPPPEQRVATTPLTVGGGALLVGAYGLDPNASGATPNLVALRVVARESGTGGELETVLLDDILDPATPGIDSWQEYRVDLAPLAGRTVRIDLEHRVLPQAGEEPSHAVGFPVWSVPRVLAPRREDARPNVLLISLDTLRADYVSAYGYEHETTPNIDRFAREGVLFENAFTTYPSTTASHVSMLTGLFPALHDVYAPGKRLARTFPTLAATLAAHGYQTAAITENAMLSSSTGVTRGFAYYRELKGRGLETDGRVREVVDGALAWLEKHRGERFFLFLHTYQVHGPYTPPVEYDVFRTWVRDGQEVEIDASAPADVKARSGYAGDLLYTDAEIGRLLAGLAALGEAENTIVLITADHGEALGEHGVIGHGWYVIEPVLHVPLVVRAPDRVPEGLRIAAPVSLADVTPTILELAGIPVPSAVQGQSLTPLLERPDDERFLERPIYTEKQDEEGRLNVVVRKGRFKWVDARPRDMRRYDLIEDPGELHGSTDPAALAEGFALVARYLADNEEMRAGLGSPKAQAAPVDEATMHKLRALGYLD